MYSAIPASLRSVGDGLNRASSDDPGQLQQAGEVILDLVSSERAAWLVFGWSGLGFTILGVGLSFAGVKGVAWMIGLGIGFGIAALFIRRKAKKLEREQVALEAQ